MIVGKNARDTDLEVNVCRKKHLTSMRESNKETFMRLDRAHRDVLWTAPLNTSAPMNWWK